MSDELLRLILEARTVFFGRFHTEDAQTRFLANETRLIDLIERNSAANILANIASYTNTVSPRTFTFFTQDLEPVIVAPSQLEFNESFLQVNEVPTGNCSICQDEFLTSETSGRLRNCGHCFHRDCASMWYTRSVLCPVCRNDIRTNTARPPP